MSEVLIEGTVSPCVELATGERARVEFTDHVARLVAGGFITIVEEYGDGPGVSDGAAGADSGESDTVRVATSGADAGDTLDAADQAAP